MFGQLTLSVWSSSPVDIHVRAVKRVTRDEVFLVNIATLEMDFITIIPTEFIE